MIIPVSACNVAVPLLLIEFCEEVTAIIISTVIIFVFAEVIPQTVCTGPSQTKIAASLCPIAKTFIFINSPVSLPISWIMNYYLGERKKERYDNDELKDLIALLCHKDNNDSTENNEEECTDIQKQLISGAIDLRQYKAADIMKKYESVSCIDIHQVLSEVFIKKLRDEGFSRYPVYANNDKNHVIGILLVRNLLGLNQFYFTLEDLHIKYRIPLVVKPNRSLISLFHEFKEANTHFALVTEQVDEVKKRITNFGNEDPKKSSVLHSVSEHNHSENSIDVDDILKQIQPSATISGIITLEDLVEKALGGYFCTIILIK